jgi:hypothetical protein
LKLAEKYKHPDHPNIEIHVYTKDGRTDGVIEKIDLVEAVMENDLTYEQRLAEVKAVRDILRTSPTVGHLIGEGFVKEVKYPKQA